MALYDYNGDFFKFVNDLIDGKVDGNFNTSADTDQELGIDNFNGTVFNGLEDLRDQFWSELLEYMYKEDENLGHSIVRDNDWADLTSNMETVFQYINSHADLDNGSDSTFYTQDEFNEIMDEYESTIKQYILDYSNISDAYEAYEADHKYKSGTFTEDEFNEYLEIYEDNKLSSEQEYDYYSNAIESAGGTPISEDDFNNACTAHEYSTYEKYLEAQSQGVEYLSQEEFESIIEIYDNCDSYKDYVSKYIEADYLSYIQNYINEGNPHWNESLDALVDYYLKYFEDVDDLDDIEYTASGQVKDSNGNIDMGDGYVEFRTDDIIHGDAGNYFARIDDTVIGTYNDIPVVVNESYSDSYQKDVSPEKDSNGKYRIDKKKTWVRPWFNIDGSTYGIERNKDKIKRVLNDNRNLQFTRYKENEQDYINDKLLGVITDYWPDANGDGKLTTNGTTVGDSYYPIDAIICWRIFAQVAAGVNSSDSYITFEDRYGNTQKINIVVMVEKLSDEYSSLFSSIGYNAYNYILKSIDNVNVKYYDNESIYDSSASSVNNSTSFENIINGDTWKIYTQNWLSFIYIELKQDDQDIGPLEEARLISLFYSAIQEGNYEDTKEDWLKFLRDYRIKEILGESGLSATLEKYLRLIMPMYERIVEIEDLDRNFWVIAQVLGGLSAYVLGDDSPIGDMFAGLADEVVQLWENVLYLWVAMGLISQEPYYIDIKKLFIPVYNSEIEAYVKFDNFTEWSSDYICSNKVSAASYCENVLKKIWENDKNIISLKDEYNESNLVILPEVRQKNYFENYYAQVVYPGMIIYNRNDDETHYITFSCKKTLNNIVYTTPVYIDLSDKNEMIREYLVGFQEDEIYYNFDSFQEPENLEELYKGAIRTIVDLNVLISGSEVQIDFSNFSLNFYDVARELAGESNYLVGTIESSDKSTITVNSDKNISFNFNINSLSSINKKIEKIRGYYLGEVVSYLNLKKFEIESYSLEAITYNPQDGYTVDGNTIVSGVSLSSISSYISYMSGSGKTSWETIVKNKATSDLTTSGTAKLYYCNSGYYTSSSSVSIFEMKSYISFVINKNGTIYYYHFTQDVADNGLNSSISYPYISSIYQDEGGVESESIEKLCLFPRSPGGGLTYDSSNYKYSGETDIYFVGSQSKRYYTSSDGYPLNTVGISIYGNMDIYYEDSYFYLKNYAIIMIDRCRLSTTSAMQAVPYYYLCKVTSAPSVNKWGEITCTYHEGTSLSSNCYESSKENGLETTEGSLTTYSWKSGWQGSGYMNNYSEVGKDGYLSYSSTLFRNDFENSISGFDFDEYNVAGGV